MLPKEVSIGRRRCEVLYTNINHALADALDASVLVMVSWDVTRKMTCVKCEKVGHKDYCTNPLKCKNCNTIHPASSTDSFYYQLEQEMLTLKTSNKISYWESKKIATNKMIKPTNTYAPVVARYNLQ